MQNAIRELAAIDRPSASDGESGLPSCIAGRLRELAARRGRARARARRLLVADRARQLDRGRRAACWRSVGAAPLARTVPRARRGTSAAALWDDLGHGRRWFRRAVLPRRPTWNVVAEAGDRTAGERSRSSPTTTPPTPGSCSTRRSGGSALGCSPGSTRARATRSRSSTASGSARCGRARRGARGAAAAWTGRHSPPAPPRR